jgi:hypothetical protein
VDYFALNKEVRKGQATLRKDYGAMPRIARGSS